MNFYKIKNQLLFLFIFQFYFSVAQELQVFKIKKESTLFKVVFDNTDLRLLIIDRYGNPKENQIASFKLLVKSKNEIKAFEGFNNNLSADMIYYLNKLKEASKLFFTDIIGIELDQHLVKLPDVIEIWFPNCNNSKVRKK